MSLSALSSDPSSDPSTDTDTLRLLHKYGAEAVIPAEFLGLSIPELNSILLTSMIEMIESHDITEDSMPTFEAMATSLRDQIKEVPEKP